MGTPTVGKKVASFSVATTAQPKLSSKYLLGRPYVLYFYPKDDTPITRTLSLPKAGC